MTDTEIAALVIRVSIGIIMVSYGVHQVINPEWWLKYLPSWFSRLMPTSPTHFMRTHGLSNLALGFIYVIGLLPAIFDWVVLAWWIGILPFAFYVEWDIGLRDVAVIAAIAALIILGHP